MWSSGRPAHPLVEGALLAVITAGLFLLSYYLPVGGIFLSFLCPVPIIIMLVKHDFKSGLLVIFTAAFLVMILSGPLLAAIYFWGFAVLGLFMGESIRRGFPLSKVLFLNTSVALIAGLILLAGSFVLLGKNPLTLMAQELNAGFKYSQEIYEKIGLAPEKIQEIGNNFLVMTAIIKQTFPALFLLAMGVNVLIIYKVAQHFLRRLNYPFQVDSFALWQVPDFFIWFFIGGFLLYLSGSKYLMLIGLNLIMVMGGVYFIQGLSIALFFFEEKHISRLGRFFFYALLFLSPPLMICLIIVSVFDLWVNFRRISFQEGELS